MVAVCRLVWLRFGLRCSGLLRYLRFTDLHAVRLRCGFRLLFRVAVPFAVDFTLRDFYRYPTPFTYAFSHGLIHVLPFCVTVTFRLRFTVSYLVTRLRYTHVYVLVYVTTLRLHMVPRAFPHGWVLRTRSFCGYYGLRADLPFWLRFTVYVLVCCLLVHRSRFTVYRLRLRTHATVYCTTRLLRLRYAF